MPRYKEKRTLINWNRNDRLRIAKQLAGAIMRFEPVNKITLFKDRFPALFPLVLENLGQTPITFEELRNETNNEQGKKIHPNRLWGRGDVVNREGYKEIDEWTAPVTNAYLKITGCQVIIDSRERFTDEEVMIAVARQGKKCANPTCRAPFSPLNPPVGDHGVSRRHGGLTTQTNCKALCTQCNLRKGTMDFDDYVAKCGIINSNGRIRLGNKLGEMQ